AERPPDSKITTARADERRGSPSPRFRRKLRNNGIPARYHRRTDRNHLETPGGHAAAFAHLHVPLRQPRVLSQYHVPQVPITARVSAGGGEAAAARPRPGSRNLEGGGGSHVAEV